MNFCATCGRRRTGDTRFCAGCGAEFAKDEAPPPAPAVPAPAVPAAEAPATSLPADEEARWDPPAEAAGWESPAAPAGWAPADATRVERQPDATRVDTQDAVPVTPAAAEPDPFASWFAADPAEGKASPRTDPPGQSQQPGGRWQSADTVYAAPAQRPPASPPPQPPYGVQQAPSPGLPGGNPSSGGRKAAFIIGVLLVMIAAGGGAYALVSRSNQHNSAQPPAPTVTANSSAAASTNASASASGSPSTSPTTSASASASPSAGLVSLGPGVASNPAEPAVEKTLTNYFQGINTHNYAEYSSALDAQERAAEPQSKFDSGYSSTADSGMKLISLVGSGDGGLAATVTFTSHQAAGSGIDGSTCDNWKLTLYLVQQGASYLQGTAPSGYSPSYSDC